MRRGETEAPAAGPERADLAVYQAVTGRWTGWSAGDPVPVVLVLGQAGATPAGVAPVRVTRFDQEVAGYLPGAPAGVVAARPVRVLVSNGHLVALPGGRAVFGLLGEDEAGQPAVRSGPGDGVAEVTAGVPGGPGVHRGHDLAAVLDGLEAGVVHPPGTGPAVPVIFTSLSQAPPGAAGTATVGLPAPGSGEAAAGISPRWRELLTGDAPGPEAGPGEPRPAGGWPGRGGAGQRVRGGAGGAGGPGGGRGPAAGPAGAAAGAR
jgi:translation initiation factor IF-2